MSSKNKVVWISVLILLAGGMVVVEERTGLLKVGDPAPPFSATLQSGERIALSDFTGKRNVVLFFYPKDFTAGCTRQVCSYRDNYDQVRALGAVMLGVSYDDEQSHERFSERYELPFRLLSDTTGTIAGAYGVRRLGGRLLPVKRVTYVIDRGGIIRGVFHHEVNIDQHLAGVLETLKGLQ